MDQVFEFKIIPQYERYYNEESNYGVYTFITEDDIPEYKEYCNPYNKDETTDLKESVLVGNMQKLYLGSEYLVTAKLEFNTKYSSWQYKPINVTAIVPKTQEQQRKFLEAIITKRQVKVLLNAYPNIVEDVINGKIETIDYSKTKGIKEFTWNNIKEKIIKNYVISDILIMLQPLGVTFNMIEKMLNHYGNATLLKEKIQQNPYILTNIHGLGFKKVDQLALKLNPSLAKSNNRIYAFLNYYLREIGETYGHTWVSFDVLENAVRDNISECEELYYNILNIERETNALLYIDDIKKRIGLRYYRDIEQNIFGILRDLDQKYPVNLELDVEKGIKEAEIELGFEFSEEQREIVKKAVKNNIVVISGRAGAGKTTIAKALLKIYKNANQSIGCCALSSKAAQRITEATGHHASTIHRLLGAKGLNVFTYNKDNPLPYDVVFLDEASMCNARIIYDLISALEFGSRLIICGDHRQLPPIGFGNIFSDLLELKNIFHVYELTEVHRQAKKSGILVDANLIRDGISPVKRPELKIVHGELQDMYYMFRDSRDALNEIAINTYLKSIQTDGLDEVIIITPRKSDCINSTKEINLKIQDKLIGDDQQYIKRGDMKFKLGAKVIQRVNNYDKNIFNGEIGYLREINEEDDCFIVEYPENKFITYENKEIDQIDLAYCLTIHLTQGSGFKTVIAVIDSSHYILLDSCLLYTAITRAKERCLLLAEPRAFKRCIEQNKSILRQTWLKDFANV